MSVDGAVTDRPNEKSWIAFEPRNNADTQQFPDTGQSILKLFTATTNFDKVSFSHAFRTEKINYRHLITVPELAAKSCRFLSRFQLSALYLSK